MSYLYAYLRRTFLLVPFVLAAITVFAQTGTVKGTVRDASGKPLNGASVTVQGSSRGIVTNEDGLYSLAVTPGTHTINVSYVGFVMGKQTVTVSASETSTVDFVLLESGQEQEIVILGSRS